MDRQIAYLDSNRLNCVQEHKVVCSAVRAALNRCMRSPYFGIGALATTLIFASPYVYAFDETTELSELDGDNGLVLNGRGANSTFARTVLVSRAGDVNGDGVGDVVIGASFAGLDEASRTGESYVVFGTTSGLPAELDLLNLDKNNGFLLKGIDPGDRAGVSVAGAGDVNGDGLDDLLVGAFKARPDGKFLAGESYVVFGTVAGFPSSFDLSSLNGTNGFTLKGADPGDHFGGAVSRAGDVNGDGIDDIIIGAHFADQGPGFGAGKSYVVFGTQSGFPPEFEVSSLSSSSGIVLNGVDRTDGFGVSVGGAGDINGDGLNDLIIGAAYAATGFQQGHGESYVVFGSSTPPASIHLVNLDGTNGFAMTGKNPFDHAGASVSIAGDINGDGIDDLAVGAADADPMGLDKAGEVYVVFGTALGFPALFDLRSLDGANGFVLIGSEAGEQVGQSVSRAGDVNDDGIEDIIVGASGASPDGRAGAGRAYVVFGSSAGFPPFIESSNLTGGYGAVLKGINPYDGAGTSVTGAVDVNGDGVDDLLVGAENLPPPGSVTGTESYIVFGAPSAPGIYGTIRGALPLAVVCTNWTTQQTVVDLPFPETSWNCSARGFTTNSGDFVQISLLTVDTVDTGLAPGATSSGIDPILVNCVNTTTPNTIWFAASQESWNCGHNGLDASPPDRVSMQLFGTVK